MRSRTIFHPIQLLVYIALVAIGGVVTIDSHASDNNWCDTMYSEYFFKEVPESIQIECKNRFIWNTNKIKDQFHNKK